MLGQKKGFGWRVDAAGEIREARWLARRAIELDKLDPTVLAGAGHALCFVVREVEDGANLLSRAINLDPNLAFARTWSGCRRSISVTEMPRLNNSMSPYV
jgi:adenylate cyclase